MHVVASVVSCTAQHSAVSIEYPLITWYIQLLQQHSVCTAKHGAYRKCALARNVAVPSVQIKVERVLSLKKWVHPLYEPFKLFFELHAIGNQWCVSVSPFGNLLEQELYSRNTVQLPALQIVKNRGNTGYG